MKTKMGNVMLGAMLVSLLTVRIGEAATWITLDFPGATSTAAHGIDGNYIVGAYGDSSGTHGFVYDGSTWTTLDFPGGYQTELRGIDGTHIVGSYNFYRGCMYDLITMDWTQLDFPGAYRTVATGIDGSDIVGYYRDSSETRGFLYDGANWIKLDFPGAAATSVWGIDGGNIVGRYRDSSGYHGFLYSTNSPPSADAGSDQTVYAGSQVALDGSGSSDPDGDPLIYTWYLGGQIIATGVNPAIQLPAGLHVIDLVVNDGIEDSQPDQVGLTIVQTIGIDIYPNRVPNRVMLSRNYTLYVAVQGSASFDVTTLDSATVKFGKIDTEASPVRAPIMRDLNSDGFVDAMYGFQTLDCGFQLGDTEGWLIGFTITGTPAEGVDSVLVSP